MLGRGAQSSATTFASRLLVHSCGTNLDTELLDLLVHPLLDSFPHLVCPGTEDIAAGDVVVVDHLRQRDNLCRARCRQEEQQRLLEKRDMQCVNDSSGWND